MSGSFTFATMFIDCVTTRGHAMDPSTPTIVFPGVESIAYHVNVCSIIFEIIQTSDQQNFPLWCLRRDLR